jgi:hypothetical protein
VDEGQKFTGQECFKDWYVRVLPWIVYQLLHIEKWCTLMLNLICLCLICTPAHSEILMVIYTVSVVIYMNGDIS